MMDCFATAVVRTAQSLAVSIILAWIAIKKITLITPSWLSNLFNNLEDHRYSYSESAFQYYWTRKVKMQGTFQCRA